MGEVFPIRADVLVTSGTVNGVVEQAYRQACGRIFWSRLPRSQVCPILINSIVDATARELRQADLLCDEALARLAEEEESRLP
jgi:hypothetical protein